MTLPIGYFGRVLSWSEDLRKSIIPIPLNAATYNKGVIRIWIDGKESSYENGHVETTASPFEPDREGFYSAWEYFFRPNKVFLRQIITADVIQVGSAEHEAIKEVKARLVIEPILADTFDYYSLLAFRTEVDAEAFLLGPAGPRFNLFDPAEQ